MRLRTIALPGERFGLVIDRLPKSFDASRLANHKDDFGAEFVVVSVEDVELEDVISEALDD